MRRLNSLTLQCRRLHVSVGFHCGQASKWLSRSANLHFIGGLPLNSITGLDEMVPPVTLASFRALSTSFVRILWRCDFDNRSAAIQLGSARSSCANYRIIDRRVSSCNIHSCLGWTHCALHTARCRAPKYFLNLCWSFHIRE